MEQFLLLNYHRGIKASIARHDDDGGLSGGNISYHLTAAAVILPQRGWLVARIICTIFRVMYIYRCQKHA